MKDRWDKAAVILAGCLVIIGGLGVIYAVLTLRQVKTQAIAAKNSLDLSRETAVRQLRAYVCLAASEIAFKEVDAPEIQIHMKNGGLTPAYNVRWWIGLAVGEHPPRGPLVDPPKDIQVSKSVLVPGGKEIMFAVWSKRIPPQLVHFIGTTKATIYVYGKVTYGDVFGNEWYTDYRLIHGGSEGVRLSNKDGVPTGNLKVDTDGNHAT